MQLLVTQFNPLNAELNPICHLLALLGAHHIFHVSGLRVKGSENKLVFYYSTLSCVYGVAQLVESLHYKPEGGGFDSRRCHWNFSLNAVFLWKKKHPV